MEVEDPSSGRSYFSRRVGTQRVDTADRDRVGRSTPPPTATVAGGRRSGPGERAHLFYHAESGAASGQGRQRWHPRRSSIGLRRRRSRVDRSGRRSKTRRAGAPISTTRRRDGASGRDRPRQPHRVAQQHPRRPWRSRVDTAGQDPSSGRSYFLPRRVGTQRVDTAGGEMDAASSSDGDGRGWTEVQDPSSGRSYFFLRGGRRRSETGRQ